MKKIYVVIKKKFPSEQITYMVKYLAIYIQRNGIIIAIHLPTLTVVITLNKLFPEDMFTYLKFINRCI